jgi:hypothetical protein
MLRPRPGEEEPFPLADAARIAAGIDDDAEVVALAREAAAMPRCVWGKDAPNGVDITRLSSAISVEAIALVQKGDAASALRNIEVLRALARHLRSDARLELFMRSLALESGAITTMVLMFRNRELPIEHAPGLLSHEDYRELARQALDRYRAVGIERIEGQDHPEARIIEDKEAFLRWLSDQRHALSQPYTADRSLGPRGKRPRWTRTLNIGPTRELVFATEAQARCFQAAVDLRAWRAQHGEYPETWSMPTDPFTGDPLRYRRRENGFVLSSEAYDMVGWSWH